MILHIKQMLKRKAVQKRIHLVRKFPPPICKLQNSNQFSRLDNRSRIKQFKVLSNKPITKQKKFITYKQDLVMINHKFKYGASRALTMRRILIINQVIGVRSIRKMNVNSQISFCLSQLFQGFRRARKAFMKTKMTLKLKKLRLKRIKTTRKTTKYPRL